MHIIGLPAVCYIIIRTQDPQIVQRWISFFLQIRLKFNKNRQPLFNLFIYLTQVGYDRFARLFVAGSCTSRVLRHRNIYVGYYRSIDGDHTKSDTINVQHSWWLYAQRKRFNKITKVPCNQNASNSPRIFFLYAALSRFDGRSIGILQGLHWIYRRQKSSQTQYKCENLNTLSLYEKVFSKYGRLFIFS